MDRRSFFRLGAAALAGAALKEAIPFGRVWSFPSKIVIAKSGPVPLAMISDYQIMAEIEMISLVPKDPYGKQYPHPYVILTQTMTREEFSNRYPFSAAMLQTPMIG
jgi:hypothetical protein